MSLIYVQLHMGAVASKPPLPAAAASRGAQPPSPNLLGCAKGPSFADHLLKLAKRRGAHDWHSPLEITVADRAFWNRTQTVVPESGAHTAFMLRALCQGRFTMAIIGGSTSAGGGSASGCWPRKHPCGSKCCGPSYLAWLSKWFRKAHNVSVQMHNGAQGGTGPEFAYLCLESLVGGPQLGSQVDLVIIEFAINEESNCQHAGPRMERLLDRVYAWAPSAAIIFVNTFSVGNPIDASRCFVPLARRFGHASLSLQDAVKPLLQRGVLNVSTVFEEPIWHHPNVEGHRWLAAIVARFLDDAVRSKVRFLLKQGSQGSTPMRPSAAIRATLRRHATAALRKPLHASGITGSVLLAAINTSRTARKYPECIRPKDLGSMLRLGRASARGWRMSGDKGLTASASGSTLEIPFVCDAGCGLTVSLTKSYQPLGLMNVFVDNVLVGRNLSCAEHGWVRAQQPQWTVSAFRNIVPTRRDGAQLGGLDKGKHILRVVALGATAPDVEALNVTSYYARHEVHFRGLIVEQHSMPSPQ